MTAHWTELPRKELAAKLDAITDEVGRRELPAVLADSANGVFLGLVPEHLLSSETTDPGARRRERGRLLAEIFDEVTADTNRLELLQARDLLGLSASDAGFQERLANHVSRNKTTLHPRNKTTRMELAAGREDPAPSVHTIRRRMGSVFHTLLTSAESFRPRDRAASPPAAEPDGPHPALRHLDEPEIRRVLLLCDGFALELDHAFDTFSGEKTSFSGDLYVPRLLQGALLTELTAPSPPERHLTVTGEAGYGKTSLLWGLHRNLSGHAGFHPLLVSAAWLRTSEPDRPPVLTGDLLVRAVRSLERTGRTIVVLVDTADLMLHEQHEIDLTKALFDELRDAGARTVLSCREQEAQRLDRRFQIRRLDSYEEETELPDAIERHVRAFCHPEATPLPIEDKLEVMRELSSRGHRMKEICRHPLLLRLLFESYGGDLPTRELDTLDVLGAYLENKVEDDARGLYDPSLPRDDVLFECLCLALAFFTAGEVNLHPDDLLPRALAIAAAWRGDGFAKESMVRALDLLLRRSVLLRSGRDGEISFRHQLLFEHVAARALLDRGGAAELRRLLGIVRERQLDLFVGAVFEQSLLHAWRSRATLRSAVGEILRVLSASDSVSLQSIALVVAAHHPEAGLDVPALLKRAEPETVRRFVELTPRASGTEIGRTLGLLRLVWERENFLCRRAVLNVLERFALQHRQPVRDFITVLRCVEQVVADGVLFQERALPRTLGLLAAHDPDWSRTALLRLFTAACETGTRSNSLIVAVLEIVADHWERLRPARPLEGFVPVLARRLDRAGRTEPVRRAGGRLFALHWNDVHRLTEPEADAGEWLDEVVAGLREELAAASRAAWTTQLKLMGVAFALAMLPEHDPLIEPTLALLFPSAEGFRSESLTDLPNSFLVPLLRERGPAGDRIRALLKEALGALPAPPNRAWDPVALRVSVAREAINLARLSPADLALMLKDLPSLSDPEQWTHPHGAIVLVVPAALGGHPVARAALEAVVADPSAIGGPGRNSLTHALTRHLGSHPELLPRVLTVCAAWRTCQPLVDAARRHREELAPHLARYGDELDRLMRDLFASGGSPQQQAVNLFLELDALDVLPHRSFAEFDSDWRTAEVFTAKQNILRIMGERAGRGRLPLAQVVQTMRSLVEAGPEGLRAVGRFTDPGTLEAAREALVQAWAGAGPLTEESLEELLLFATAGNAELDVLSKLRLPLLRLVDSGCAREALAFYARIGARTADRGSTMQNKLANKLRKSLVEACTHAGAERNEFVRSLPSLPVPFAQMLVRALTQADFAGVRAPLQDLAARTALPTDVVRVLRRELDHRSRNTGSTDLPELVKPPTGTLDT